MQHFQEEYHIISSVLFDVNRSPRYLQNIHLSLAQISISYFSLFLQSSVSGLFLKINWFNGNDERYWNKLNSLYKTKCLYKFSEVYVQPIPVLQERKVSIFSVWWFSFSCIGTFIYLILWYFHCLFFWQVAIFYLYKHFVIYNLHSNPLVKHLNESKMFWYMTNCSNFSQLKQQISERRETLSYLFHTFFFLSFLHLKTHFLAQIMWLQIIDSNS